MIKADDLWKAEQLHKERNELSWQRQHFQKAADIRLAMPNYLVVAPDCNGPDKPLSRAYESVRAAIVAHYDVRIAALEQAMRDMGVDPTPPAKKEA